jgi:hypothetical protein
MSKLSFKYLNLIRKLEDFEKCIKSRFICLFFPKITFLSPYLKPFIDEERAIY